MRRLLFLLVISYSQQSLALQSPLIALASQLQCAQNETNAAELLMKLSALSLQPLGLPSDNFANNEQALLYAASVDILLHTLYQTMQKYPALTESAERVALLWNYCALIVAGELVDLHIDNKGEIVQRLALNEFPAKQQGLRIWGFLKPDPNNRYIPKIITAMAAWPLAHQTTVFQLYAKQCFPHPDTGELIGENNNGQVYGGELHLTQSLKASGHYPYSWQAECKPIDTIQKPIAVNTFKVNKIKKNTLITKPPQVKITPPVIIHAVTPTPPISTPKTTPVVNTITNNPAPKETLLAKLSKAYEPPKEWEYPALSPAIAGEGSNNSATVPQPIAGGYGLAGNFYHRSKLTGVQAIGAGFSYHPVGNFFIRSGVNYNYYPDNGKLSYSWGLGYDDWHSGTVSMQLNNWGPIVANEGLALEKAVANIGYKFEAAFLKPYNISGAAGVDIPIHGDAKLSTTWSWSPFNNWFIRASLQRKFDNQGTWSWAYNFGYSNWRPFSFSVTYDNWGANPIFDNKHADAFNFQENGAISVSWSWSF